MNVIIGSIVIVLVASIAFAGDLKVKVGDKDVTLNLISINHELKEADKDNGGRDSALE